MFTPPNILLIQNFEFERADAPPKDKFLIILMVSGEDAIIAPLTTSQDFVPDHYKIKRCIKDDPSCIHCYFIPKTIVVGKNGFFFLKDTFVHLSPLNLKKRSLAELKAKYEDAGKILLQDSLTDGEYSDFLYCVYKSHHVPRGVKRTIEPLIEKLELDRNSEF